MKRILSVALASALFAACGNGSYTIKGSFDGVADSTMVTLSVIEDNSLSAIDSVMLMSGQFTLKGKADSCQLAFLTFPVDGMTEGCQLFLEGGTIKVGYDSESGEQSVSGTPNNDAFQDFYVKTGILNDKAMEIQDKLQVTAATNGESSGLIADMNALQDEYRDLLIGSITDNADKYFGYQQLLESYDMLEPEELNELLMLLEPNFGDQPEFMILAAMNGQQMSTATGAQYMDFKADLLDLAAGEISSQASLSDYVSQNKVTMLDFWASWCTPCMGEIPYLKAAYEKYASKGFQIVSVSVDEETEDWKNAIVEQGMTWPQMWNGNDDMENSPAVMYTVSAIPSSFLIDSEGTIIGRNLRGEELEAALADYFQE